MLNAFMILALAADPAYAKPELLVEAGELAKSPDKYVILDARGLRAYDVGHITGARRVDVTEWAKAMSAREDAKAWSRRLGALGIEIDRPVVVYGVAKTVDPARVWWILRYWGVKDVRLLNGGYDAYVLAGGKSEKAAPVPKVTAPVLKAQDERLATKEQLLAELKAGNPGLLIDTRTADEYCGATNTAKRNGAIPGAKHLNWAETLDKDGKFKSAPDLSKLFKEAGIDPTKPATTYCQSGGRAAVMAFAVELMGGRPVRNYYRSWSEWGNDEKTPVVKPKK